MAPLAVRNLNRVPTKPPKSHSEFGDDIEIRAAAVERCRAALRRQVPSLEAEMESSLEERYGSDPEAREAVQEEFEAAVRELDARLEQEQRQRTGAEAKRIHEEHEQRLKKEVEALVTGHMEWRAAELEKRRLQLKEANAERLRAMRCRVEEAEEQAVAMAAQLEDEETERRLAELEGGMAEETARALSELEGRMEQEAGLARARVHEEARVWQGSRMAGLMEGLKASRKQTRDGLAEELRLHQAQEEKEVKQAFWLGRGAEALQSLREEVEAEGTAMQQQATAWATAQLLSAVAAEEAEWEGVKQGVLAAIERGSFVAEEEYTRTLPLEPRLREAKRRYESLTDRLVEVVVELGGRAKPLRITEGRVRRLLREYERRRERERAELAAGKEGEAGSGGSLSACSSAESVGQGPPSEGGREGEHQETVLVGQLTLEGLMEALELIEE